MAQIGPPMSPALLLAQSVQQAARRGDSAALREFAAQLASVARAAGTPGPASVPTAATAPAKPEVPQVRAAEPPADGRILRPGSVLNIVV